MKNKNTLINAVWVSKGRILPQVINPETRKKRRYPFEDFAPGEKEENWAVRGMRLKERSNAGFNKTHTQDKNW